MKGENGYRQCDLEKDKKLGCDYQACDMTLAGCEQSAIQTYRGYTQLPECKDDNESGNQLEDITQAGYKLGFIEFDEHGLLYDREQMRAVLDMIRNEVVYKKNNNALIVVFMHGWQHSAAPTDCNLDAFKSALARLRQAEENVDPNSPRKVIGVYLGWRGETRTVLGFAQLTFWDRKSMAEKIGHVGLAEVLTKLEEVRNEANSAGDNSSKLIIIGHSFGATAIYAALSQILAARFVRSSDKPGQKTPIEGFGDLVVLISPAFEALSFTPLSDMSTERKEYPDSQLPVLAILTSENDWATRYAFPIGRAISTLFDRTEDKSRQDRFNPATSKGEVIDENQANVTAVGHFEPYWTHC